MARKVEEEHPNITVRAQEVSTLRKRMSMKQCSNKKNHFERLPVADSIESLKKVIATLGKDEVRRIVELL